MLDKVPPDRVGRPGRPPPNIVDSLVNTQFGRKVEIHSSDDGLKTMNSLTIKENLTKIIGKPIEINRIFNGKSAGNIMIHCKDEIQTKTLLDCKKFGTVDIVANLPARWNTCQGVISGRDLREMSDGEILIGQNEGNGIIDAFHFPYTNKQTKERENSNTVCVTFDSKIRPDYVYIGYIRYPVSPYYPNPMRCFRCQSFGHTIGKCKEVDPGVCAKCTLKTHNEKECTVTDQNLYKCSNCNGNHPAWSRDCPKFIKEKKVCKYKVDCS